MRTRTAAAVAAALIVTLAGCGGSTEPAKPEAAATAPVAKAATTSAPAPTPAQPLSVGKAYAWTAESEEGDSAVSVTVLGYTQPARGFDFPTTSLGVKDPEWVTVEIKACVASGVTVTFSQGPWTLAFPDDTRVPAPVVGGAGLPSNTLAYEGAPVAVGDCVRGTVPFAVPKGQRPAQIIYGPSGAEPVKWAVPAE
jgi:hypothetical protein